MILQFYCQLKLTWRYIVNSLQGITVFYKIFYEIMRFEYIGRGHLNHPLWPHLPRPLSRALSSLSRAGASSPTRACPPTVSTWAWWTRRCARSAYCRPARFSRQDYQRVCRTPSSSARPAAVTCLPASPKCCTHSHLSFGSRCWSRSTRCLRRRTVSATLGSSSVWARFVVGELLLRLPSTS